MNVLFAGIAVADYHAALPWYECLFGRAPDMLPHETEAAWQVTELGWIYLVGDSQRAGKALLTLMVTDLAHVVAELEERGLAPAEIETAPGLYRKATFTDPEGNTISFGEALGGES